MKYLICVLILMSVECAASPHQKALELFVGDLVEIQRRSYEPSVNFCHDSELEPAKKIKSQYNTYIAFYGETMLEIWVGFANKKEYEKEVGGQIKDYKSDPELMAMQTKQGAEFLKITQAQPDVFCGRLSQMMMSISKADMAQQIEEGLLDYRKRRAEFCATIPTPENCK